MIPVRGSTAAQATPDQVDALLLFFCGALVLLAAFGLAFYVGGLGGRARAARAFRFVLVGVAVTVILAVAGGYGMVAGSPLIGHLLGRPDPGLASLAGTDPAATSPYPLARAGYVIAVLVLCTAVVAVAISSRLTLRAWIVFTVLWLPLVVFPVAYGVFSLDDGWAVAGLHVVDFGERCRSWQRVAAPSASCSRADAGSTSRRVPSPRRSWRSAAPRSGWAGWAWSSAPRARSTRTRR
ncbi:hypothetical protein ACRAWB_17970 [Leifsonia poae]|uniref:hypothetical protein n=1 Tax=Leifsonia poae TaxID=110933 RepID=UPI003D68EB0F